MFGQSFHLGDIGTIGFLIILEALLSADNALVLAIMVRHLPKDLQQKALLYGLGGAFVLRTAAILLAAFVIKFWWLQLIGALYLLYLPYKHFKSVVQGAHGTQAKKAGFWPTVVLLNLVDTAFALDSVIVAVAVVDTVRYPDKLWVVVAGAIIGMAILRFAAGYFIRLLERFPVLDHVAYLLVGWAGVKLLFISGNSFERWYNAANPTAPLGFSMPEMPGWLFWAGMAIIAIGGGFFAFRNPKPIEQRDEPTETIEAQAEQMERIMPMQFQDRDASDTPSDAPQSTDGRL